MTTILEALELTEWAVSIRTAKLPLARVLAEAHRAQAEMKAKVDEILTKIKDEK